MPSGILPVEVEGRVVGPVGVSGALPLVVPPAGLEQRCPWLIDLSALGRP